MKKRNDTGSRYGIRSPNPYPIPTSESDSVSDSDFRIRFRIRFRLPYPNPTPNPYPTSGSGSRFRITALALFLAPLLSAAEVGDHNGDGRVSFADAYLFGTEIEPAPGAADFMDFTRCTEISPKNASALYKLGRSLLKLGKHDEAKRALHWALRAGEGRTGLSEEQQKELRQLLTQINPL